MTTRGKRILGGGVLGVCIGMAACGLAPEASGSANGVVTVGIRKGAASESVFGGATGRAAYKLALTGGTGPVPVTIAMQGTAVNGVDYEAITGPVMLNPGLEVTLLLNVIDDAVAEPTETAILQVLPGAGYTVGDPDRGTVFISSNE